MIKILWFSNTPANADEYFSYNLKGTGGWLKALNINLQERVDLHIAFYKDYDKKHFKYQKTNYYPIKINKNLLSKIFNKFWYSPKGEEELNKYLEIIKEVEPDIIHIHGTETPFITIIPHVKVPVVVSIQGNITVYRHKYFSGFEKKYLKYRGSLNKFHQLLSPGRFKRDYNLFLHQEKIEQKFLHHCKNIIGRTEWDRRISRILAPNSEYFHVDEILRQSFYLNYTKKDHLSFNILTINGNTIYKGFETLCQAIRLLSNQNIDFNWYVAGIKEDDLIVRITKIKLKENYPKKNIHLMGNLSESDLIDQMMISDLYVMPSHIENSPNNLCEAMIFGLPCIATFSGGTSSLLTDSLEGILVQDGDPFVLAGAIVEMFQNKEQRDFYGQNARKRALARHNRTTIIQKLIETYDIIISNP